MLFKMYSVYDQAAGVYDRPIPARGHGEILRVFGDLCVSSDHHFGQHPEHYTLFYIGEFDDERGVFIGLETGNQALANGIEMVGARQKVDAAQLDAFAESDEVAVIGNGSAEDRVDA